MQDCAIYIAARNTPTLKSSRIICSSLIPLMKADAALTRTCSSHVFPERNLPSRWDKKDAGICQRFAHFCCVPCLRFGSAALLHHSGLLSASRDAELLVLESVRHFHLLTQFDVREQRVSGSVATFEMCDMAHCSGRYSTARIYE